jgi:hypothetical protein
MDETTRDILVDILLQKLKKQYIQMQKMRKEPAPTSTPRMGRFRMRSSAGQKIVTEREVMRTRTSTTIDREWPGQRHITREELHTHSVRVATPRDCRKVSKSSGVF